MNMDNHPCFNDKARHMFGRIHLPVAPECNIQCNYCNRLFDCVNESRPGVTSGILSPVQALTYLDGIMEKRNDIKVVGIAGPGDPFANAGNTIETLRLVREKYPDMLLCVATNGLDVPEYAGMLAGLNVSHVTVTINAIDAEIGAKIYSWVRYGKKIYRGVMGARVLHEHQMESIKLLKKKGIVVKINAIIIPGINDRHIVEIAKAVKEAGADILNCIPLYPNKETAFEKVPEPDKKLVKDIRLEAGIYVPQMNHCSRCRADAVGMLDEGINPEYRDLMEECAGSRYVPSDERPYIAVTSREGFYINRHLGEADKVWIYKNENDSPVFLECRKTPAPGTGDERWIELSGIIKDCGVLLTGGAGDKPSGIFSSKGIRLIVAEGLIEETLADFYRGIRIGVKKDPGCGKGTVCSGNGTGCG